MKEDKFGNKREQSKTEVDIGRFRYADDVFEERKIERTMIQKQSLLQKVSDENENIQDTQNTMKEISDLMNNFSVKILEQDEVVTTIMNDAEQSNINIKEAGKELKKAHEYQKGQDKIVAGLYIIMAVLLLVYDRVTAIHY